LITSPARIGQLAERAGQWASVHGSVVKVNPFSAGVKFTLDDGTGRAEVVLWRDLYNVISPSLQLTEGAQVSVQGEVSLYRGEIELVPELPADVTLVAAAPAPTVAPTPAAPQPTTIAATAFPTPQPTVTPRPTPNPTRAVAVVTLGQLTPADKGKLCSTRGKITAVIPFSRGMKYRLDDGTGKVILLLWQEVLDKAPDLAQLTKGMQVSVTGVVDVFGGDIEIVPRWGADVQVIP
jgi:DNA/RNA endonuclease YhcR with UshA esterase domain